MHILSIIYCYNNDISVSSQSWTSRQEVCAKPKPLQPFPREPACSYHPPAAQVINIFKTLTNLTQPCFHLPLCLCCRRLQLSANIWLDSRHLPSSLNCSHQLASLMQLPHCHLNMRWLDHKILLESKDMSQLSRCIHYNGHFVCPQTNILLL